jgi:hypothetical protein
MTAALTSVTKVGLHGSLPINIDEITFVGPTAYPTGGTTGFEAVVSAILGRGGIDVLGIVQIDASGYVLRYDKANDKLFILYGDNNNASDGPLIENATADLSGTTFRVLVLST